MIDIQSKRNAIAATVNRAKPSAKELISIFEGYILSVHELFIFNLKKLHAGNIL